MRWVPLLLLTIMAGFGVLYPATAQSQSDTTMYISYSLDGTFSPQAIAGTEEIGMIITNPSPGDSIHIESVTIPLYKRPGQNWPSTRSVTLKVYSFNGVDPVDLLYSRNVYGDSIRNGWGFYDSTHTVTVPIDPEDYIHIGPASYFVISVLSNSGDSVLFSASDAGESDWGDEGPCNINALRLLKYENGQWDYQFNKCIQMGTTIGGPADIGEAYITSTAFDYYPTGCYRNHEPLTNDISININPSQASKINSIEVFVGNSHAIYGPSDWAGDNILNIADQQMCCQAEGGHLHRILINGTEYERRCFYNQDKPLYSAPWATTTKTFTSSPPNGEYLIQATVPPDPINYSKIFPIWTSHLSDFIQLDGVHLEQRVRISDPLSVPGAISITDDVLSLKVPNRAPFNFQIPLSGSETVDQNGRRVNLNAHFHYPVFNYTFYNGTVCNLCLPPWCIVALRITASAGAECWIDVDGNLYHPLPPYPTNVITAEATIVPKLYVNGDLEVLWGAFSAEGWAKSDFFIQYSAGINNNGSLNYSDCYSLYLDYDVTAYAAFKLFKIAEGNGRKLIYDDCSRLRDDDVHRDDPTPLSQSDTTYFGPPVMALSPDGSKLRALFLHREAQEDVEIYYSQLENSDWSPPAPVTQTNSHKSDVEVTSFGSNSFAAIWVQNNAQLISESDTISMADLLEYIKGQDIYAAIDNGSGWGAPVPLTTDQMIDGMPVIAGFDDKLLAVWVRNQNEVGLDRSSMSIYYSIFDGTNWSAPVSVPGQSGYNSMPAVAADTNAHEFAIVWASDADADIYTPGNRSLKLAIIDAGGYQWTRTISSAIGPASPDIAIGPNGEGVVCYETYDYIRDNTEAIVDTAGWGNDVKISSSVSPDWDSFDGDWSVVDVGDYNTTGFGSDPHVTVDSRGDAQLAYRSFKKDLPGFWDGGIYHSKINLPHFTPSSYWGAPEGIEDDTTLTTMGDISTDPHGKTQILYLKDMATGPTFPEGYDRIWGYTIGSSCSYVIGDANGSGNWTGQDVTYSVRFFKGGNPPPYSCECTPGHTWYVSGDVNGSCTFTGQDVTRMVLHFKLGVAALPCPDCLPAAR